MTNVYSFDGLIIFSLLFICSCAYIRQVPRLKKALFSEKKGVWGAFYKAAVLGVRLHWLISLLCLFMALYLVFFRQFFN